jgi:hypothetical protein
VTIDDLNSGVLSVEGTIALPGVVSQWGNIGPSVIANYCQGPQTQGSWVECLETDPTGSSSTLGAHYHRGTLINGPAISGLKGLDIYGGNSPSYGPGDILTLVDSSFDKTTNTIGYRPSWDALDAAIGLDCPITCARNAAQLAIRAPVALSNYIGAVGDNVSYLERLTATQKTINVPLQLNGNLTIPAGYNCIGLACGPFSLSGTQINDLFNRANGPLGSNWTETSGTWAIASNTVSQTPTVGSYSLAAYTGSTFSKDQYSSAVVTNVSNYVGVSVRNSNSAETGYFFLCESPNSLILKAVAGTVTSLVSGGPGCNQFDVLTLEVVGTNLYAYDNGTLILSTTDSSITSGYPGLAGANTGSSSLDKFYGGNLAYATSASLTVNNSVTLSPESPNAAQAACYATGGILGHCTSAVNSSGACTCVTP